MSTMSLELARADVSEAAWDSLVQEMLGKDPIPNLEIDGSTCWSTYCSACLGCSCIDAPDTGPDICD
jgi:hypothetical protein